MRRIRSTDKWRRRGSLGQAGLGVVLAMIVVMVAVGGQLVNNVIEHDPLVQNYSLEHLAYRAVQAGVNDYLEAVNANPYLINCNTTNQVSAGPCLNAGYGQWVQIPGTGANGLVDTWFMWDNPQLCFNSNSPQCSAASTTGPLQFVSIVVMGAAGNPANGNITYQSEAADLVSQNGFLTHLFWDNLNASPTSGYSLSGCSYNHATNYGGPGGNCNNVVFGSADTISGPLFSNDSIYVSGTPTFFGVTTHDPNCVFVGSSGTKCSTSPLVPNPTPTNYSTGVDNAPLEPIPTDDTELAAVAARQGCLYSGPTTISFTIVGGLPEMAVWSSDTPSSVSGSAVTSTQNDGNNLSTNPNHNCMPTVPGGLVKVPEGVNGGNGVIYVENVPQNGTCVAGSNPFGDQGTTNSQYQLYWPDTSSGTYDCIGDAFVSDLSPSTAGIQGPVTVASEDDIIITGNLEYSDCGGSFTSNYPAASPPTVAVMASCAYNSASSSKTNDALGLIAEDFVEVNNPISQPEFGGSSLLSDCGTYPYRTITDGATTNNSKTFTSPAGAGFTAADSGGPISGPNIPAGTTMTYVNSTTVTLSNKATATASGLTVDVGGPYGSPAAALCVPNDSNNNLFVDAAVLALNGAFTVNNWTVGSAQNKLVVFGSIDENWRGPVGTVDGSGNQLTGYGKAYTWDARLSFVSPPSYLNPGTPAWALASSGDLLNDSCKTQDPWGVDSGNVGTKRSNCTVP